jgi:hypothetical protein
MKVDFEHFIAQYLQERARYYSENDQRSTCFRARFFIIPLTEASGMFSAARRLEKIIGCELTGESAAIVYTMGDGAGGPPLRREYHMAIHDGKIAIESIKEMCICFQIYGKVDANCLNCSGVGKVDGIE